MCNCFDKNCKRVQDHFDKKFRKQIGDSCAHTIEDETGANDSRLIGKVENPRVTWSIYRYKVLSGSFDATERVGVPHKFCPFCGVKYPVQFKGLIGEKKK